jgi:UDP-N-acetylmuramoyl-L-alanyl-D-glutamate--2,6-diaminopimelate ligase
MAQAAERFADLVIVTSDNPRSEDPKAIIDDIIGGFAGPDSAAVVVEPDRAEAIELAIGRARPTDVVLIAGKGHEDYQIIGEQKLHFNDKEVALQALEAGR